jgi:hypothetical protein
LGRKTLINNFVPFKCSIMSPGGLVAWLLLRLKVDRFFTWVSCFPFLVFCCSLSMLLLWLLFKKKSVEMCSAHFVVTVPHQTFFVDCENGLTLNRGGTKTFN